jgi:hypothetical protein
MITAMRKELRESKTYMPGFYKSKNDGWERPTVSHAADMSRIQRKASCACGGGCPGCAEDEKQKTIQTRLQVSAPGDRYEQEADRVAEQIMQIPESSVQPERMATAPERMPSAMMNSIQRLPAGEAVIPDNSAAAPLDTGGGRSLRPETRQFVEPRFGVDFSNVRVHDDRQAQEKTSQLQARAFTSGNHIWLGANESENDKSLMAHELTHVVQQAAHADARSTVQRAITIVNPGAPAPHPPPEIVGLAGAMGLGFPSMRTAILATQTNALLAMSWINRLCPTGNWKVDGATGVVSSPDSATFCAEKPVAKHAHHSTSGTPTSCGCLCELTAPSSAVVNIHVADIFTVHRTKKELEAKRVREAKKGKSAKSGKSTKSDKKAESNEYPINLEDFGEGVHTSPSLPERPEHTVGVSGLELQISLGAGATDPVIPGAGRKQILHTPPWLIFGHEVCGHVRFDESHVSSDESYKTADESHVSSREGKSVIDIENRIRREHSTVANNLGMRLGYFHNKAPGGGRYYGGEYIVSADETLPSIAKRCGIPSADALKFIFRAKRVAFKKEEEEKKLTVNEKLFIEGIDWHEVISGETMTTIAKMWDIPLASLIRANPEVPDHNRIAPGQRLLIPVR